MLTTANSHTRMGQLSHARALFDAFTARLPTPLSTPTCHFTELMLLVRARAYGVFGYILVCCRGAS